MKNIFVYLLICLLLPLRSAAQDKSLSYTSIRSERNKTHIDVRVNGVLIEDILLDTGFAFDGLLIYNPAYTDSLDTGNAARVTIGGAGDGEAPTALMFRSDIKTGNLTLNNHNILLLESDIYKGFPSNGIIGHSLFGHYLLEINYDSLEMIFYDIGAFTPGEEWTVVPLYFKNNSIPWTDIKIDTGEGDPVEVSGYIDFAAGDELVLLEKDSMKYKLPAETKEILIGRGLRGDIYGRQGKIASVSIGNYRIEDLTVSIADAETRSKQQNADLIIGNALLKRFDLVFDYHNNMLYLKPNTNFPGQNR